MGPCHGCGEFGHLCFNCPKTRAVNKYPFDSESVDGRFSACDWPLVSTLVLHADAIEGDPLSEGLCMRGERHQTDVPICVKAADYIHRKKSVLFWHKNTC